MAKKKIPLAAQVLLEFSRAMSHTAMAYAIESRMAESIGCKEEAKRYAELSANYRTNADDYRKMYRERLAHDNRKKA